MLRVSRLAAQVARTGRKRPTEELYLNIIKAVSTGDPTIVRQHVDQAAALADQNELSGKDFSLILNSAGKISGVDTSKLLTALRTKLVKNRRFLTSLVPTDIALMMLSVAKLAKGGPETIKLTSPILARLSREIPLKLSLFENHQLAQVLHAISLAGIPSSAVIAEIVTEIETCRDIASFSPQSVVMIASALARIKPSQSEMLHSLWNSIQERSANIPRSEMQPNWPDVLLTAAAFAGEGQCHACSEFARRMADEVYYQFKSGKINEGRVAKAVHALVQLNADARIVEKLRVLC